VAEAADLLAARGLQVSVLHLPTIKPLDGDAVVAAARATGRVITIEEQSVLGGLGGAVAELLSERHPVPVTRLGIMDCFGESGPNDQLLDKYRLSARRLADDVAALLAGPRRTGAAATSRGTQQGDEIRTVADNGRSHLGEGIRQAF
jgi:transketolase